VLVGFERSSDAAIYKLSDDLALVLTVDFFPPIVDDPFQYGAIAAANALSDVYAMGGQPIVALNIVAFPRDLSLDLLGQILAGGAHKAAEAGVAIVGGHSVNDDEPKYGLAVTGVVKPGAYVTNSGARPGDRLVLTKAIGTGIIATAGKNGQVDPEVLAGAVESMMTLNRAASEAMIAVGVDAATDITGFGLLGHLKGMMSSSGVAARVSRKAVPALPGAVELIEAGVAPGGTHRNVDSVSGSVRWHSSIGASDKIFLCDAQTSGGLLIAVAEGKLRQLLDQLKDRGVTGAVIGEVRDKDPGTIEIIP
jgi:selenide,water dikinase